MSTAAPVPVGTTAVLTSGVLVTVAKPRVVTVSAQGPGEVAGDAVSVAVSVRNSSPEPFDLGSLAVNGSYGSGGGTPAAPTDAQPAAPMRGRLAPGASASGTYVFQAPRAALASLRVEVSSSAAVRVVVFRS